MTGSLPLFHRIAGKPVIVLGEGDAADARKRLVTRAGGVVVGESDTQARLAFIAMDEPEAAVERLRSRGLLINVTDRPDLCDFTMPSILDRSPVLIAIGTGGASAGLAKALRLRLEQILPQSLGRLAEALGQARERLRARFPDTGERRRALDRVLSEGGVLDPLRDGSADSVAAWLDGAEDGEQASVIEIRLRSSDPEDLTLREARLLGSADVLAHEPDIPAAILDRARADAVRVALEQGEMPDGVSGITVIIRN